MADAKYMNTVVEMASGMNAAADTTTIRRQPQRYLITLAIGLVSDRSLWSEIADAIQDALRTMATLPMSIQFLDEKLTVENGNQIRSISPKRAVTEAMITR
ncbi:hypothetical protein EOD08_09875 [Mesorhizobium sp. M6A.T.Ca.TU.002.02.2.1]|nr:hypothetical protein EOD08_09875 [Mesorhizobium sp. M6A.T.Ca.TU.002.02.2.1]